MNHIVESLVGKSDKGKIVRVCVLFGIGTVSLGAALYAYEGDLDLSSMEQEVNDDGFNDVKVANPHAKEVVIDMDLGACRLDNVDATVETDGNIVTDIVSYEVHGYINSEVVIEEKLIAMPRGAGALRIEELILEEGEPTTLRFTNMNDLTTQLNGEPCEVLDQINFLQRFTELTVEQ